MARVEDIAAYLCKHYPHKSELSKTRLTKLVYLVDWKSVQRTGKQATPISWRFHHYGPYVEDVITAARQDSRFDILETLNHYGDSKLIVSIRPGVDVEKRLSNDIRNIVDEVIKETSPLYWNAFLSHVYNTAPIAESNRYQNLDLKSFADLERGNSISAEGAGG